jgi:hypothetical protein
MRLIADAQDRQGSFGFKVARDATMPACTGHPYVRTQMNGFGDRLDVGL